MTTELHLSPDGMQTLARVIGRLVAKSPFHTRCIFLNCEMEEMGGNACVSPDLFAVVKLILGKAKRSTLEMDWETSRLLMTLGRELLATTASGYVTMDLIIDRQGKYRAYQHTTPLKRLGGRNGYYNSAYKEYVSLESWLERLDD